MAKIHRNGGLGFLRMPKDHLEQPTANVLTVTDAVTLLAMGILTSNWMHHISTQTI